MLKQEGQTVVVWWVWKIHRMAWEKGRVPLDWKTGMTVEINSPCTKGKGRGECVGTTGG